MYKSILDSGTVALPFRSTDFQTTGFVTMINNFKNEKKTNHSNGKCELEINFLVTKTRLSFI